MKKSILTIAGVCAAACCFAACEGSANNNVTESSKYDNLNEMLNKNYSQIVLTVKDTFDEDTYLTSEYTIKYSDSTVTVTYSVEKFTELSLDNPSAEVKTTLIGEIEIKNGTAVLISGIDINLTADIAEVGLTFKEEYFENTTLTDMTLQADVTNVSAFVGSQLSCTDMKVKATFIEMFYNINITYTSESGSFVEYSYIFSL